MQQAIELKYGDNTLRGMLHLPDEYRTNYPVVCMYHGFTGNKSEAHFVFTKLSRILMRNGIASVRFDFSGSGDSDGDFSEMSVEGEVEEAIAIINYVKEKKFIDNNRIGLLGLSMGGIVAASAAALLRHTVKSLCLWAPAFNIRDYILSGKTKEQIDDIISDGHLDVGGLTLGGKFFNELDELGLYQRSMLFGRNVLIIHGEKDQIVPVNVSKRLLDCYRGRAKLVTIAEADHTFSKNEWENQALELTLKFFLDEYIE